MFRKYKAWNGCPIAAFNHTYIKVSNLAFRRRKPLYRLRADIALHVATLEKRLACLWIFPML